MADNQNPADGVRLRVGSAGQGAQEANGASSSSFYDGSKVNRQTDDPGSLLGLFWWCVFIVYIIIIYCICLHLEDRLPTPLLSKMADDGQFCEESARKHLDVLSDFGPRPTGSDAAEVLARNYILGEIEKIGNNLDKRRLRFDVDVQKPSGCFNLIFLSNFTHCYKNLTNIVVRLGRRDTLPTPSPHSLLLSCHFDSVSQSPGATDDAIGCAVMLELMNIFSRGEPKMLPYDLIFLFNGAEENFLQASHGFITSHPWRHSIRAFINLEGAGAGGREMVFQSGPANIWLLHAYLNSAPHPHCSIMAQEIFQSGLIPADTDFRIYRDFGRIPGMDIAYMKNGYVYHTEFDKADFVEPGAIQRAGENILATMLNIFQSPCFTKPCPQQETKLVYFDFIGLFAVWYSHRVGTLLNYATVTLIVIRIARQIQKWSSGSPMDVDGYTAGRALWAFVVHVFIIILMAVVSLLMIGVSLLFGLTLSWYSWRPMVLIFYMLPPIIVGFVAHAIWNMRLLEGNRVFRGNRQQMQWERVTFDTAMLIFGLILFALTWKGLASAYYIMLHAAFPLTRDIIRWAYEKLSGGKKLSPLYLLLTHGIALFPVIVIGSYGAIVILEFFIPIMGRSGPVVPPEFIIAAFGWLTSVFIVLYMAGMVYISCDFGIILKWASVGTLLIIAFAAFTDLGAPYVYSPRAPRLRRLHVQHVSRSIYGQDGKVISSENALFIGSLDYRGVQDLPKELLGSGPPPCIKEDAYCGLPYHVPVKDMFPADKTLWKVVPNAPTFHVPIKIKLTSTQKLGNGNVKMNFAVTGCDHMTVFVTQLNNWTLHSWSLTEEILDRHQNTHFIYLAYVGQYNGPWEFSLTLSKVRSGSTVEDDDGKPKLLLGVASHYFHGRNQYSSETKALLETIRKRRSQLLGDWKWAMTMNAHNSEYVAHYF